MTSDDSQRESFGKESKSLAGQLPFGGVAGEELAEMLQLKAIYGLTTQITKKCFTKCIDGDLNRKMENDQRICMANCAVNYLTVKMLSSKKLIYSAKGMQAPPK
jgi:hypothetical protein